MWVQILLTSHVSDEPLSAWELYFRICKMELMI